LDSIQRSIPGFERAFAAVRKQIAMPRS